MSATPVQGPIRACTTTPTRTQHRGTPTRTRLRPVARCHYAGRIESAATQAASIANCLVGSPPRQSPQTPSGYPEPPRIPKPNPRAIRKCRFVSLRLCFLFPSAMFSGIDSRRAAIDRECDDSLRLNNLGNSVRCGHVPDRQPIYVELLVIEDEFGHDRPISSTSTSTAPLSTSTRIQGSASSRLRERLPRRTIVPLPVVH